jgi:hypothetical protein
MNKCDYLKFDIIVDLCCETGDYIINLANISKSGTSLKSTISFILFFVYDLSYCIFYYYTFDVKVFYLTFQLT